MPKSAAHASPAVPGDQEHFVPACGRTKQGEWRCDGRPEPRRRGCWRGTAAFGADPSAPPPRDALRGKRPACIHAVHPFGILPHPRPSPHAIQGMRLRAATSSRLANASGRDTASVHAVLPFGIHASTSLVVACDAELRPCARTCAPERRSPKPCRATRCFRAVSPPAPCRDSAAVTGPCHPTRHPWLALEASPVATLRSRKTSGAPIGCASAHRRRSVSARIVHRSGGAPANDRPWMAGLDGGPWTASKR